MTPRLVAGLGNPGPRYARTRHNAGFLVADHLARKTGAGPWMMRCRSLVCEAPLVTGTVVLAKPLTYVNLSGQAVRLLLEEIGAGRESLVLVLDDLNLPLGRIRVRPRGSAGGHHGLESVIAALGSEEFARVRLGVGQEEMPTGKAEYVLSDFPPSAEETVEEMIARAAEAVRTILNEGVDKAMADFNA